MMRAFRQFFVTLGRIIVLRKGTYG